jgi:hypothetical protein
MSRRLYLGLVMAAAMTVGVTADARAQQPDTTTAATRIRVQKDRTYSTAPGTVARDSAAIRDSLAMVARQDSIARAEQMRLDSIASAERARQDSIARVEQARRDSIARVEQARRDSIARADSIRAAQERAWATARGFYVGLAAGAAVPTGDFGDLYDTGFNVTGSLGWQRPLAPLGVRLDLSYSRFGGTTVAGGPGVTIELDDVTEWAALLDAKFQLPFGTPDLSQPVHRRSGLYLIGGVGAHNFRDMSGGNDETNFGVNGGAGFQFGWGMSTLFIEGRYVSVFADPDNINHFPIVIGVTF